MAFDLSKFAKAYDFTLTTKSFGEVQIGSVKLSHLIGLEKLLINSNVDGVGFSKELLLSLGYKKIASNDDENALEDAKVAITKADLELIGNEDIEIFAQEFLAHNSWLLNTHHKTKSQIDTSEKVERNSAYLLRAFKIYLENEKLRLKKITEPVSDYYKGVRDNFKATDWIEGLLGKSLYKDTTIDSIKSNLSLSDKLHESILGFNKSSMKEEFVNSESFKPIKFPENPIYETNKRLNTVISTMESMKPLVADSAELIRSMNDTAIQMQADFIKSARGNQLYAKWAMAIAVFSLFVTSYFSWLGYEESKKQGLEAEKTEKMMETYQQDMLKQNKKFEDIVRIFTLNAEADAKRQAQHDELVQTLNENAKNKSK